MTFKEYIKEKSNYQRYKTQKKRKDFATTIFEAIYKNDIDFVKQYIKDRKDLNIQDNDGFTPLHVAVSSNRIEITKLLLDNGADPNIKDMHGNTALHDAASVFLYRVEILKLLLDNGANLNIKNKKGWTPLDFVSQGDIKMTKKKKLQILQKILDK